MCIIFVKTNITKNYDVLWQNFVWFNRIFSNNGALNYYN